MSLSWQGHSKLKLIYPSTFEDYFHIAIARALLKIYALLFYVTFCLVFDFPSRSLSLTIQFPLVLTLAFPGNGISNFAVDSILLRSFCPCIVFYAKLFILYIIYYSVFLVKINLFLHFSFQNAVLQRFFV